MRLWQLGPEIYRQRMAVNIIHFMSQLERREPQNSGRKTNGL